MLCTRTTGWRTRSGTDSVRWTDEPPLKCCIHRGFRRIREGPTGICWISGWAGASRLLLGGTLIPSLDRLGHSEPIEGQRPTDSDADSAGGFAPLAEQPRFVESGFSRTSASQSPHLAQLVNRRSGVGHRRTFSGHHSLDHRAQVTLRDVEGSGDHGSE